MEERRLMLDDATFITIVNSAPLISVDILPKKDGKVLLGKRINKPAQGYFFSVGGRINKNETINQAIARISKDELNVEIKSKLNFIGVFEHFYKDSIYKNTTTHYVNLAYEYEVENVPKLPEEQHSEYQWFSVKELLDSAQVHQYVKDYFED